MTPRIEDLEERLEDVQAEATDARIEVERARSRRDGTLRGARKKLKDVEARRLALERLLRHERSVSRGGAT